MASSRGMMTVARRLVLLLFLAGSALLTAALHAPASADPGGGGYVRPASLPVDMVDRIHEDLAPYIVFESDEGILAIDPAYDPRRIYEPVRPDLQSPLMDHAVADLMDILQGGEKTLLGLFLVIKSGSFCWPGDLRFQASIHRKDRLLATLPMDRAFFGLIGAEDAPEWIDLGDGRSEVLIPRGDRIAPARIKSIPQMYRIYLQFPAKIEDQGRIRDWNPFKAGEVSIEPVTVSAETVQR
jgi:hypothetical protein